ncbi:MAG: thermonuclease family protein [bacterium]
MPTKKTYKLFIAIFAVLLILLICKKLNNPNITRATNLNDTAQSNNQSIEETLKTDDNESEEINQQPIVDNKNSTPAVEEEIKSESAEAAQEENTIVPEILNQQKSIEQKTEENNNQTQYYKVIKIIDGDTIAVDIDGNSETIRLIGINTPETKDPRKPVECFGIEASNKAEELLAGQLIELEKDETQDERDKYGRLLRYVKTKDGLFYDLEIIKQGYGYEYTYNIPYKYQKEFKEAENYARENKLGLWADGACGMENMDNDVTIQNSAPALQSTECECSSNKYNCSDFKTHAEAQAIYDCCGGADSDVHKLSTNARIILGRCQQLLASTRAIFKFLYNKLDNDKDGEACESLP